MKSFRRPVEEGNSILKKWEPAVSASETSPFRVKHDAPRIFSAFLGVVLSSDLRVCFVFRPFAGINVRMWLFGV